MAEERDFHFPHDHNASEDPKLVAVFRKFGDSGIGFYWRIIERLANRRKISLGDIPDVAFAMHTEESKFQEYLDFFTEKALLCQDSEHFWSNGLNNRLKALDRVRELNANAGRISGEKRREKSNNRLTSAQHLLNTNPTSVEQRDREIERERGSGGVF